MPDWNGLGFQQLAAQGVQAKANRQASAWQQVIDAWMKTLDQYQQQDYMINKQMPAAQANAEKIQGMGDQSALERLMVQLQSGRELQAGQNQFTERQDLTKAQWDAAQKAQDRAAEDARYAKYNLPVEQQTAQFNAQLKAQGQKNETPPDFWTAFANATNGLERKLGRPFDPKTDMAALKQAFLSGIAGDPNQKALLDAYDAFMKTGTEAPNPVPTDPEQAASDLASKIGLGVAAAAPIANGILAMALGMGGAVTAAIPGGIGAIVTLLSIINRQKIADKIPIIRDWANRLLPGLGDKIFSSTPAAPPGSPPPAFGSGSVVNKTGPGSGRGGP